MHVQILEEFDIVIQMTLEQALVQRFKKKEMDKKITFNTDMYILQSVQIPLEEWFSYEFIFT